MLDLVIRNARIADGSGKGVYRGNVGVKDGRIAFVSRTEDGAAQKEIDGEGLVVSPGFIDPHTHVDAQIVWDNVLSPSIWHGVTSMIMGNCGVGLAPVKEATRDMLLRDLVNVEGVEYEVLQAGVDWNWSSVKEYLDHIGRNGLGCNVGAMISQTAIRHYVMGAESIEREANAKEIEQMVEIFDGAMQAGAFGFSSDLLINHVGWGGGPLACRNASEAENKALCAILKKYDRGVISIALDSLRQGVQYINEKDVATLRFLTGESGRPVTFLPMVGMTGDLDFGDHQLERLGDVADKVVPQVSPMPIVFLQTLMKPFKFSEFPAWREALNATKERKIEIFKDPTFREKAKAEQVGHIRKIPWERVCVIGARKPALAEKYNDRYIQEIADKEGKHTMDVFLDIALEDDIQTLFQFESANLDRNVVRRLLQEPRFMLGISDAGAHIDQVCDLRYPTVLLGDWVRKEAALSLEFAIWKLTNHPATVFGIKDRGLLKPGYHADICLFDPTTIGSEPPVFKDDLPGGGQRLSAEANGIIGTWIGGTRVMDNGKETGDLPGRILDSGE